MVERLADRTNAFSTVGIQRLPSELVSKMLEYLPSTDLWPVAAVSRTFHAIAWRSGLFIHRTIYWSANQAKAPKLDVVNRIVQHTLCKDLRLSLTVLIYDSRHNGDSRQLETRNILSTVTTALPVLVRLCIDIPDHCVPELVVALSQPAPQMRDLYLEQSRSEVDLRTHPMPSDLFAGHAPKLRTVTLRHVVLGDDPVAAFSYVTYAILDYCGILPDGPLSAHFPRLSSLRLTSCQPEHGPPPTGFSLGGTGVRRLCISESQHFPRRIQFQVGVVPDFERVCAHVDWTEALWLQNPAEPLSVRIKHREIDKDDTTLVVVPSHRRWRRAFHLDECDHTTLVSPLADMPGANERLTHLRLDNSFLVGLLEADRLRLDALCELRVDFSSDSPYPELVWPPDHVDDLAISPRGPASAPAFPTPDDGGCYLLSCRNLQRLKLFARDQPVTVQSAEVAFLGHALGQSLRPIVERPILELVGVEFDEPVARTLLEETFSSVFKRELVSSASDAHDEGGMWSGWLSEE